MKAFFARLLSKEVADLQIELEQAKRQRDWYKELWEKEQTAHAELAKANAGEIRRNRNREDKLTELLLETVTPKATSIPQHHTASVQGELLSPEVIEPSLSDADHEALWQRAVEYLAQTAGPETIIEHSTIETVYKKMLADPQNWLSN